MLNPIWLWLVLLSVFIGGFSGKLDAVTGGAFKSVEDAVMTIALPLAGAFALWLGIMRLAELSGLVKVLARVLRPITTRLFPDVPPDHPAVGSMTMNVAANMLGIGNAATPLGLRAMRDLEKLNPYPGVASNAMCTFLAINTGSVQLIPTTAVSILAIAGARNPTAIIGSAFLATLCSSIVGLVAVKFFEKLPAYRLPSPAEAATVEQRPVDEETVDAAEVDAEVAPISNKGRWLLRFYWVGLALLFVTLAFPDFSNQVMAWLHARGLPLYQFAPLSEEMTRMGMTTRVISGVAKIAVPFMFSFFPLYAWLRGVKVYEEFVEGAKEGFGVATRIIPFLVAILVAVRMFREAGGIQLVAKVLGPVLERVGFPVDLLPLVLVRPLSGGASTGLFTDVVKTFGPDSMNSMMAATIMGSTETTFYVIAVYFGAVSIRRTRHAVPAGLLADLAGVIAAIFVCRMMFL